MKYNLILTSNEVNKGIQYKLINETYINQWSISKSMKNNLILTSNELNKEIQHKWIN